MYGCTTTSVRCMQREGGYNIRWNYYISQQVTERVQWMGSVVGLHVLWNEWPVEWTVLARWMWKMLPLFIRPYNRRMLEVCYCCGRKSTSSRTIYSAVAVTGSSNAHGLTLDSAGIDTWPTSDCPSEESATSDSRQLKPGQFVPVMLISYKFANTQRSWWWLWLHVQLTLT